MKKSFILFTALFAGTMLISNDVWSRSLHPHKHKRISQHHGPIRQVALDDDANNAHWQQEFKTEIRQKLKDFVKNCKNENLLPNNEKRLNVCNRIQRNDFFTNYEEERISSLDYNNDTEQQKHNIFQAILFRLILQLKLEEFINKPDNSLFFQYDYERKILINKIYQNTFFTNYEQKAILDFDYYHNDDNKTNNTLNHLYCAIYYRLGLQSAIKSFIRDPENSNVFKDQIKQDLVCDIDNDNFFTDDEQKTILDLGDNNANQEFRQLRESIEKRLMSQYKYARN